MLEAFVWACRPWKPQSYALWGVLVAPYSNCCQEEMYTQTQTCKCTNKWKNTQKFTSKTGSWNHESHCSHPISLSGKKQLLTSARLHRELKKQEVWQRSPLQKVKERPSLQLLPVLERRCGVCGDGGKLNPIWWIWETKWSSSWWSSHTSSCKSEDCSSREMSIVWKCHLHCRALPGLLEAATQLH